MFGFALSGLQDFLYDVSDDYAERRRRDIHAAKRLRIRSAVLSLVPALVAHEIRRAEPHARVVYLGGGKLLMGASIGAAHGIEPALREIYEWMVCASDGKLGAYWTMTGDDAPSSSAVRNLLDAMAHAKWRAGRGPEGWAGSSGLILGRDAETLGNRDWEATHGGYFARRDGLTGFAVGEGDAEWRLGPWKVQPTSAALCDIPFQSGTAAAIDVAIPRHVPRDQDGSVAPLFKLAEEREGAPYLGLLKLDGDGIGQRMARALAADSNLEQYRAASGALRAFFGERLMRLLEERFPRVYLVYSGGDDLVATGHFDVILRAARAIREEYRALDLGSVSAGIAVYPRNSPILKAAEAAQEELANAKTTRDAISVAGCRLSWGQLDAAIREVDALVNAVDSQRIHRGALQLLRRLGEPWLDDSPPGAAALKWRSVPMLHYARERREWGEDRLGETLTEFLDRLGRGDGAAEETWRRAALVGTLASWRTRTKQEE